MPFNGLRPVMLTPRNQIVLENEILASTLATILAFGLGLASRLATRPCKSVIRLQICCWLRPRVRDLGLDLVVLA